MGAWANITFSTYEETIQAYEQLKNTRPKFRDGIVYGSLRNVKDPRTVVISVVRQDVTEKQVKAFLNELAEKSVKITTTLGEEETRKYEFFSYNIIESKKFYKTDDASTKGVTTDEKDTVQPSWIEINEVPRRLIIHFFHEFSDEDIKELNNDIALAPGYEDIFLKGDSKKQLRLNHQKGHVNKDGDYIKHTEIRGKKKVNKQPLRGDKPQRPRNEFNQGGPRGPRNLTNPIDFGMAGFGKGNRPPKVGGFNTGGQGYRPHGVPQIGAPLGGMPNMAPPPLPAGLGGIRHPGPPLNMPNNPPPFMQPGGGFKPPGFPNNPMLPPQIGGSLPPNLGSFPPGANLMKSNLPPPMPPMSQLPPQMPPGFGQIGLPKPSQQTLPPRPQ
jgi:hypothetical protein